MFCHHGQLPPLAFRPPLPSLHYGGQEGRNLVFPFSLPPPPVIASKASDLVFPRSGQLCSTPPGLGGSLGAALPRASPGVIDDLSPLGYAVRPNRHLTPKRNRCNNEMLLAPLSFGKGVEGERPGAMQCDRIVISLRSVTVVITKCLSPPFPAYRQAGFGEGVEGERPLFNPFRVGGSLGAAFPRASPGVIDRLSPLGYGPIPPAPPFPRERGASSFSLILRLRFGARYHFDRTPDSRLLTCLCRQAGSQLLST